jgi:hypothetical protein
LGVYDFWSVGNICEFENKWGNIWKEENQNSNKILQLPIQIIILLFIFEVS